jgi:hypothetical protein
MSDTDSKRVDEFVQEFMPWMNTPDTTPVVLERTALANFEYRAKTGEMLRNRIDKATQPEAKRTLRERLARLLTADGDAGMCECDLCEQQWEQNW